MNYEQTPKHENQEVGEEEIEKMREAENQLMELIEILVENISPGSVERHFKDRSGRYAIHSASEVSNLLKESIHERFKDLNHLGSFSRQEATRDARNVFEKMRPVMEGIIKELD